MTKKKIYLCHVNEMHACMSAISACVCGVLIKLVLDC